MTAVDGVVREVFDPASQIIAESTIDDFSRALARQSAPAGAAPVPV